MSADFLELRAGSANEALATEALSALMRDTSTLGIVGVVILRLMPDVALMRLRPEQLPDFHAALYDLLRRNLREPDRLLRTDEEDGVITRTVYKPGGTPASPAAIPVVITLGISDGSLTEVVSGLDENDSVITSAYQPTAAPGRPANPFGGSRR